MYGDGDLALVVSSVGLDLGAASVLAVVRQRRVLDAQSRRHVRVPTACRPTRSKHAPVIAGTADDSVPKIIINDTHTRLTALCPGLPG